MLFSSVGNNFAGTLIKSLQNKFSPDGGQFVVKQCHGVKENMLLWLQGNNPHLEIIK